MAFSGVDLLKLQFSRAIDQTFEHFLDSWSVSPAEEGNESSAHLTADNSPRDIPVNISA